MKHIFIVALGLIQNYGKGILLLYVPLDNKNMGHKVYGGESLRQIPFSHAAFLRYNGAQERSIIQFIDLLSHWLSLVPFKGTQE